MIYATAAGRITKDAEFKFTANGDAVLSFTVASDVGYGEKKHAVFTRCSVWGKRGESLAPYITKGLPVTVVGELDLREWGSNGKSGASLEMRVQEIALQGGKNTHSGNDHSQSGNETPKQQGFRNPAPNLDDDEPSFDDDGIPF